MKLQFRREDRYNRCWVPTDRVSGPYGEAPIATLSELSKLRWRGSADSYPAGTTFTGAGLPPAGTTDPHGALGGTQFTRETFSLVLGTSRNGPQHPDILAALQVEGKFFRHRVLDVSRSLKVQVDVTRDQERDDLIT